MGFCCDSKIYSKFTIVTMNHHPKLCMVSQKTRLGSLFRVFRNNIARLTLYVSLSPYSRKKSQKFISVKHCAPIIKYFQCLLIFHSHSFIAVDMEGKTLSFSFLSRSSYFVALMIIKFQGLSHALLKNVIRETKKLLRHTEIAFGLV